MLRSFDELKKWLNCDRDADVERLLKERRIPYTYGKGRKPVTTDEAINSVLIRGRQSESEVFDFGQEAQR